MISNGDLSMAERWCQFVLEQPIFQSFSMANRGILQRLGTDVATGSSK